MSDVPKKQLIKINSTELKKETRFKSFQKGASQTNLKENKKKPKISRLNSCNNQLVQQRMNKILAEKKKTESKDERIHHKRRSTLQVTDLKKIVLKFSKQQTNLTGKAEESRASQTLSKSKELKMFEKLDPSLTKLVKIYKKEIEELRQRNKVLEKEKNEISRRLEGVANLMERLN